MKLNPPASSSDLEVARKIARRLHQRARGAEPTPDPAPAEARPPSTEGRPPSLTSRAPSAAPAAPSERELDLRPEPPELSAPEAPLLEPEPPGLDPMEPEPPVLEPEAPELEPEPPELEPMPPGGYTADTGSFPPSAPEEPELQPPPFEPEPPGGYTTDTPTEPEPPVPPEPVEPEEPSLGDADVGPSDTDDAFSRLTAPPEEPILEGLEAPGGAGVSPEDLIPEEPAPGPGWSEPSPIEAELAAPGEEPATTAEDLALTPKNVHRLERASPRAARRRTATRLAATRPARVTKTALPQDPLTRRGASRWMLVALLLGLIALGAVLLFGLN